MNHKNLEIERLRAVAVILTILVHAPFKQLFPAFLYSTFTGVDLFFVISGFVVTLTFIPTLPADPASTAVGRLKEGKDSIAAFYLRRIFRIAPTAFFYIGLYWLAAVVMRATGSNADIAKPSDIFREGIAFAGGIYNYALVAGAIPTTLSHYYSLSIEEHFYLLAPMLLVLCGKKSYRLTALFTGIGVVIFIARPMTSGSIADLSHTRFDELLDGSIIALLLKDYRNIHIRLSASLIRATELSKLIAVIGDSQFRTLIKTAIGLLLCAILALLPGILNTDVLGGVKQQFYFSSTAFLGYTFVSVVLVILASVERGWILEIPVMAPVLEYIGSRSYSIYLGHVLVIEIYSDLYYRFYESLPEFLKLTRGGYSIQFAIFLGVVLLLAEASYRFIENPFRKTGAVVVKSFKELQA